MPFDGEWLILDFLFAGPGVLSDWKDLDNKCTGFVLLSIQESFLFIMSRMTKPTPNGTRCELRLKANKPISLLPQFISSPYIFNQPCPLIIAVNKTLHGSIKATAQFPPRSSNAQQHKTRSKTTSQYTIHKTHIHIINNGLSYLRQQPVLLQPYQSSW